MRHEITVPDDSTVAANSQRSVIMANALELVDVESHAAALDFVRDVSKLKREIEEFFEEPKRLAHQAHKSITSRESMLLKPLDEARRIATAKIGAFETEQRRKADEERRRLEALARAEAEEKRRKDLEAAEAERKSRESAALAEAETLEAAGRDAEAMEAIDRLALEPDPVDEVVAEPIESPVIHVAPQVAKVEGVTTRKDYVADVTDVTALLAHIAARPELHYLVTVSQAGLNALARTQRQHLKLPGVAVREVSRLSVRP